MNNTFSTSYALSIERQRGLPVSIQCVSEDDDGAAGSQQQHTLTLLFGYEFAVIDPRESIAGEVISQDLPSLEYFILHHVAREIGLLSSCDLTPYDENVTVVGLSNIQPDEWERDIACTELTELPPELICLPLRGIMQANYVGSAEASYVVEEMLTETIVNVLNGNEIRTQGILQTAFIGSRVIEDPRTASGEWKPLPAILGTTLSAVVILGAMGAFLLISRNRRKKRNQRSEVIPDLPVKSKVVDAENTENSESGKQRDIENPTNAVRADQEVPSVDPLMLSIATSRTASETIVDTDDSLNLQDGSIEAAQRRSQQQQLQQANKNTTPPSVINLQERPKAADGKAMIRPPPKPPLPVGKPPASPLSRGSSASAAAAAALSKPLKQRRRKKRKKKPKMVRVNSRERVKEMETIAEIAEEETADDNDSEYSWYSETDSNASSRDVSPSRASPVPSTTSSEDQIMVQLQQSLMANDDQAGGQQLLLSQCGSSSKEEDSDDEDVEVIAVTETASAESSSSSSSSSKEVVSGSSSDEAKSGDEGISTISSPPV